MNRKTAHLRPLVEFDDPRLSEGDREYLNLLLSTRDRWEVLEATVEGQVESIRYGGMVVGIDRCINLFWANRRGFHDTVSTRAADL
jgi:hypothetical protein